MKSSLQKKSGSSLKEKAELNVTAIKKEKGYPETPLKKGSPLEHSVKHEVPEFEPKGTRVGCSIGSTVNMENYQSLRVDCWISDECSKGETPEQTFCRLREIAIQCVEETVGEFINQ